ncbi:MAG: sugar ABC transporter ATP-binding protein [Clostridiales bacterium]|jgi:simple sugar transport system ATP-binding protein|nr:sugar ABC transporter ATP-binding protein [Clostridiales bacterium]
MADGDSVLRFENVGKSFYGNTVLKNISFSLEKGKIMGLVGENGAGKSTMMKILFYMDDIRTTGGYEGSIYLDGEKLNFSNPKDAINAGIGMVHQEFSLIPGFTATENILLNREFTKKSVIGKALGKKLSTIDMQAMRLSASEVIELLGVNLNPDMLVSDMPVGHKQFVEISREINREKVKVLIFDEPTAVLTESEAQILLKALRKLAEQGTAIIFISHRLQEIVDVCDSLVVLRDGELIKSVKREEGYSVADIAKWMVGRDVQHGKDKKAHKSDSGDFPGGDETLMEVRNLWVNMAGELVNDVSLDIKKGEVLGIGGLAGQGKLGIPNGIMGLMEAGGTVLYKGQELRLNEPRHVLDKNIAFVSEDRRGVGLLLDEPIYWNITFSSMQISGKYLNFIFRDERAMREAAQKYIDQLEIRCVSAKQKVRELSGGNQQKICLAKAFDLAPELLFVSEPTRGIDVGAKYLVIEALRRYNKENGVTIVMVSSELEELRVICDRIAIISDGRVAGILDAGEESAKFGLLMAGLNPEEELVSV